MSLPVESSSALKGMAKQLAVMLNTGGKEGRKAWENLHVKLADLATSIADTRMTIEALLNKLKETGSPVGSPDAQVLLGQMMEHVVEKFSAQSVADASQAIPLLKRLVIRVAHHLNMTPLCNSVDLDMIDWNTGFVEENMDYMINSSAELSAPNAPYTVVSIVGPQSSGKSYLLNHLFGTTFPVMDPKIGWSRTTRGILMSRCIEPSMLVMDIDGFDGRERGEDNLFENQAALFALTVSDLMLVNISVFDIGREHGGGRSVLKTIFRERTKLPPGLTHIVVVLRQCNGETTLEVLRQDVMKTLEEIWRSVNKESTTFTNYIEINIVGLPDKNAEDFKKEATTLRKLLRSKSTSSAKVPASSFSLGSKMLWDQIKQKKKSDLPSHMILPATLYCQQTVEACMGQVEHARELTEKLDEMTEERQRREEEKKWEQEKHNREKEEFEHIHHILQNELEIQKERTRKLEERLGERARGVDARSALLKGSSNDPINPNVQLMGSIYYGDEGKGMVTFNGSVEEENGEAHSRIHMPPESSPRLVPGIEGPYAELEKKLQNSTATPLHFPLDFLKAITCDFSTELVLGQGGFGVVYKGVLTCGKIIAVKKLFEVFLVKEETFQNEVCYHMGIKHPNVVQFLGCCAESSWHPMELPSGSGKYILAETMKRLLCFEFVCNKSLDKHISDGSSGLEWNKRYKIIKGICNGLHFLHEECHMVHLDLKPQNILMDYAMMPKIADFGLSRIFGEQQSRTVTKNNNVGTLGYMAPEYLKEGVVSYKADIFSLGVITLEIIAGASVYRYFKQDNPHHTDPSFQQFIEKVIESWRNKFGSAPKYEKVETYTQQVKRCVAIALKCVDPDNEKRPAMKYIMEELNAADQIGDSHFELTETPYVAVEISKLKEEIDPKLDGGGITGSDEKAYPDEEHINVDW